MQQRVKPLVHSNGRAGRRLPKELARQERIFMASVMGEQSVRQIAARESVSPMTVRADLRREYERRAAELGSRREFELVRAISTYEFVIAEAVRKSNLYDGIAREGRWVSDGTLQTLINARTRIDRLLGLDAPTRVDVGLQALLDAMEPGAPGTMQLSAVTTS